MMKATNAQYQNFSRRFEVVKCLKKQETCSKQKKVARNQKSCSKVAEQLMDSPTRNHPTNHRYPQTTLWTYCTKPSNVLQSCFTQSRYGKNLHEKSTIVCDSHDNLTDESKPLNSVFIKNNYSTDFIERNTYVRLNNSSNNSYTTTAIPYIRGTSETIARMLRPYNIRVAHKPMLLYNVYSQRRTKTNLKTDQKQFIGSNAPTARPLISVRPTET